MDLQLTLRSSGLSIGDKASLALDPDGRVAIYAVARKRGLFLMRRAEVMLGHLGPTASRILARSLEKGDPLRVRIVAMTPEHLATDNRPDLHVSVWGHP
jgi:hypothetical protein